MTEIRRAAARRALAALDLTDLSDTPDEAGLDRLCARAATRHGKVAAVCVWPRFVARARAHPGRLGPGPAGRFTDQGDTAGHRR